MQEKTRRAAGALGKAVLYGGAAALGLAILTFLFASTSLAASAWW